MYYNPPANDNGPVTVGDILQDLERDRIEIMGWPPATNFEQRRSRQRALEAIRDAERAIWKYLDGLEP